MPFEFNISLASLNMVFRNSWDDVAPAAVTFALTASTADSAHIDYYYYKE